MSDIISSKNEKNAEIPAFLRHFLFEQYQGEAERIEAGYACKRFVTLRANRLKTTAEKVSAELAENGITARRIPWYSDAFVLDEGVREADLQSLPMYARGEIYLQSLSSMLPPLFLAPKAGETVLDMAAAPGGKTTQLAALSEGKALITACEKDKIRFERLKFNLARQGAAKVNALCADAALLDGFFRFDKILLDAPCSGSGTVSLGGKISISEKMLRYCVKTQETLLKKAVSVVKKGGTLIYSTCSVLKQENEEVLRAALPPDCRIEPISLPEDFKLPLLPGLPGTLTVCPDENFEGFFVAKIVKV